MGLIERLLESAPWREVVRETVADILEDNCFGLAAQLAFYFFLALFPALLVLVALVSFLPIEDGFSEFLRGLGIVAPREVLVIIRDQLTEIASGSKVGDIDLRYRCRAVDELCCDGRDHHRAQRRLQRS